MGIAPTHNDNLVMHAGTKCDLSMSKHYEEERHESYGRKEYQAIASLANDQTNISFEDILRAE